MVDATSGSRQQPTVLLVEDNPGDTRLAREAFSEVEYSGAFRAVASGDGALDYLYQRGEHAETRLPDLVLLDWHLPRTSGEAVLKTIKGDDDLRQIPVIVMTGSRAEKAVANVYESTANACISKPSDPDELVRVVRVITEFWLAAAELPPVAEGEEERTTP